MTFLRVPGDSSIIPIQRMTTPTEMHHFSINSLAFRHVHSTVGFGCCFGKDVDFGLFTCDYSLFYGQTLIMNSVRGLI